MKIPAFHGTASDFSWFRWAPCGLHFGTLDQAVHAATHALARLSPQEFVQRPEIEGWRGRLIQVELDIRNPKRLEDVRTNTAWNFEIAQAEAEGYDGIVYENAYEGRHKADSYVVWDAEQITILENYYRTDAEPEPESACAM
jgi:hypothetical protein